MFFKFTVEPQQAFGSGAISFSDGSGNPPSVFVSYTNADGTTGETITSGPDLPFQVGTLSAVPEPSPFLVVLFVGSVVGLRQGRRWLSARRPTRMSRN